MMRTNRLLKFTLSIAVLAFLSGNMLGQELNDGTDNLPDLSEDTDGSAVDHVTEGYRVPYYVKPDEVLNSNYGEPYIIGEEEQGFGSSWSWDINEHNDEEDGVATGTIHNSGYDGEEEEEYGFDHPYVEVEWTREDDIDGEGEQAYIEVREDGPSDVSCTGDWNWLEVQVYAEPSFTFMDNNNGGTNQENPDSEGVIELCDDGDGIRRDILIASIADNGIPIASGETFENGNFKFRLDRDVWVIDEEGNEVDSDPVSESIDEIVTVSMEFGEDIVLLSDVNLSADPDDDGTNEIIRYRFDFGTTIEGETETNNGITDPVQRKSQYLSNPDGNDQDYDYVANSEGEGDMLTIITYPAPETGNIHYVPDDFDM